MWALGDCPLAQMSRGMSRGSLFIALSLAVNDKKTPTSVVGVLKNSIEGGRWQPYSAGLVFFSPTTRSPFFHSPRFLSNSIRSNRFNTLRFTADELDDL